MPPEIPLISWMDDSLRVRPFNLVVTLLQKCMGREMSNASPLWRAKIEELNGECTSLLTAY